MKVVDMHCDTISALMEMSRKGERPEENLRRNGLHMDLEKMRKGDYLLQNFAMFVPMLDGVNPLEEVLKLIDLYYRQLEENEDLIRPVYCWKDIERNAADGKMSAMLTVEEGGVCRGELSHLRNLYRLGVRMLTLTWNYPNELGWPNLELPGEGAGKDFKPDYKKVNRSQGLTETGQEFVREMERLGMIVDVSHLSDAGFYDVARIARKPFVASHSDAREVCPWCRNLDDDMIRLLAQKGGVTGLNFCADFLKENREKDGGKATIASVVEHAKHIVNVGGTECLGLGSDFDGIATHDELPDASCLPLLAEALKKGGFTESQVDKIFSGNVLRVYREALG